METEDGWVGLGVVGQRLANIASDFDPRTYGYRKLSDLVRGSRRLRDRPARRPRHAHPAPSRRAPARTRAKGGCAAAASELGHFARCFRRRHALEGTLGQEGQLDWETSQLTVRQAAAPTRRTDARALDATSRALPAAQHRPQPASRSPSRSCRWSRCGCWPGPPLDLGYWLALPLAIAAAGFLVRLFLIQHDCGHGSFFRHRLANDWIGRVARRADADAVRPAGGAPMPCITPPPAISTAAASATSTRSRSRNIARARSGAGCAIALYRHPLVMFGIGPAYLFFLQHRLPVGLMRDGWRPWAQRHGDQSRDRPGRRPADLADRRQGVPAGAPADHAVRGVDRRLAVLRAAPVRADDLGRTTATGTCTRRPCMAARTTTCRRSCAGSPPISACTTSIICAAASPTTGCRACCAIIRNCAMSAG